MTLQPTLPQKLLYASPGIVVGVLISRFVLSCSWVSVGAGFGCVVLAFICFHLKSP